MCPSDINLLQDPDSVEYDSDNEERYNGGNGTNQVRGSRATGLGTAGPQRPARVWGSAPLVLGGPPD